MVFFKLEMKWNFLILSQNKRQKSKMKIKKSKNLIKKSTLRIFIKEADLVRKNSLKIVKILTNPTKQRSSKLEAESANLSQYQRKRKNNLKKLKKVHPQRKKELKTIDLNEKVILVVTILS